MVEALSATELTRDNPWQIVWRDLVLRIRLYPLVQTAQFLAGDIYPAYYIQDWLLCHDTVHLIHQKNSHV